MPSARLTSQMIEFAEAVVSKGKYRDLDELTTVGIHRLLEKQGRARKRPDGSYEGLMNHGWALLEGDGYEPLLEELEAEPDEHPGDVAPAKDGSERTSELSDLALGSRSGSRTITLGNKLMRFLENDITSGTYEDFSDLARAAIRDLMNETGAADFYRLKADIAKAAEGPFRKVTIPELRAEMREAIRAEARKNP